MDLHVKQDDEPATLKVIKKVDGVRRRVGPFEATNPSAPMTMSPGSVVTDASATADFDLSKVVAGGSSVHLAEQLHPGYTAGAVTCEGPTPNQDGSSARWT